MDEENKIQEGEVISEESLPEISNKKKRRKDLYVELFLFFVLGTLIGITVKTEAAKRITMGYNDYQMEIGKQDYNINKIQTDLTQKSIEENSETQDEGSQNGAAENGSNQDTQNTEELENQTENESSVPVSN